MSVHCCLVVTYWDRADISALFGDVYCIVITFPCGILGQLWYLIVSFPDLCRLSYFDQRCDLGANDQCKYILIICPTPCIVNSFFF